MVGNSTTSFCRKNFALFKQKLQLTSQFNYRCQQLAVSDLIQWCVVVIHQSISVDGSGGGGGKKLDKCLAKEDKVFVSLAGISRLGNKKAKTVDF